MIDCTVECVRQELVFVGVEQGKLLELRRRLALGRLAPPVLVFVQSRRRAEALCSELKKSCARVAAVHSKMPEEVVRWGDGLGKDVIVRCD